MAKKRCGGSSKSLIPQKMRKIDNLQLQRHKYLKSIKTVPFADDLEDELEEEEVPAEEPKLLDEVVKDMIASELKEELADDICKYITDSCSTRLIRVLMNGFNYMKRCNRQKFTIEDFERGLHFHALERLPYLSLYPEPNSAVSIITPDSEEESE